jgi:hypothetical protein
VPVLLARARVTRALALLERDEIDAAAKQLQELEQDHDLPAAARALCLCGLGEVAARRGELGAAELLFTRVRVIHFDVADVCARATWQLGKTLKARAVGKPESQAAADACFREVLERYGDTRYAALARRELP